jgi:hypothetical protein
VRNHWPGVSPSLPACLPRPSLTSRIKEVAHD